MRITSPGKISPTLSHRSRWVCAVNKDGSLSRVTNWDSMTPAEQQQTMRILGKRNQTRMRALQHGDTAAGDDG